MLDRYARNLDALTEAEVLTLSGATVAVVGCGGLGGYLIEYLGRIGVGAIIAADGDVFEETNLNRQLLADAANRGENKAEAAKKRMARVNPLVRFTALPFRIDEENGPRLLRGADLILDAVDGIPSRFALQAIAEELGVPLVHGAVAGWYGQVATVRPGDRLLDGIYGGAGSGRRERGIEERLGNLSFGPALIAALQAAEAVKTILGRGDRLGGKLLAVDLLENDFEILALGSGRRAGKEAARDGK